MVELSVYLMTTIKSEILRLKGENMDPGAANISFIETKNDEN